MRSLLSVFPKYLHDETGATSVEYAVIASLLSVVIVGSLLALNGSITNMYEHVRSHIQPALAGAE